MALDTFTTRHMLLLEVGQMVGLMLLKLVVHVEEELYQSWAAVIQIAYPAVPKMCALPVWKVIM